MGRNRVFILLLAFLLGSCSSLKFTSQGIIPLYLSRVEKHKKKREIEGTLQTFLWGNFPKTHELLIDKELRSSGLIEASNIKIEHWQSFGQVLTSVLSLGMIAPVSYRIKANGMEADDGP